jgi:2-polyprenyl-6-methoxyphenol hydroxylase-like FAD-dependent oxidoreductase
MSENVMADVAIVGYGPTGQILALLLSRMGHRVTVIERWPDLYPLPRAVHFDHEIARILQAGGVIDDVNAITETIDTYQWRNAERKMLLELDWRGIGPSGWPMSNMFAQPDLERVLDQHVKRQSTVTVRQGWSATALTQQDDSVRLEIERGAIHNGHWQPTGERDVVQARWVIGADGANSFVRQSLGIAMHDLGFAFDWLVVDVQPQTEREWVPKTWQLCDPKRPTTIVPGGPGRRRWEFMLLPGETQADMNRAAVAWQLLQPWDITPDNAKLERHAVYTFRGQWATQWRQGRVLLAGDAAHLMPPFAGQGMCSGMRDSMALAWRLDAVLRGKLNDGVMDSYGPERCGHVQQMIGLSIELGKVICITDPAVAAERDREMLAVQARPETAPAPPPEPQLGPGLWTTGAPGAGYLGIQAEIDVNGRRSRFDDVLGVRFSVIARDAATLAGISATNRAALALVDAVCVHLGSGEGAIADVQGGYAAWLDQLGCSAVFTRPDFYVQGGARNADELNALLDAWRTQLAIAA